MRAAAVIAGISAAALTVGGAGAAADESSVEPASGVVEGVAAGDDVGYWTPERLAAATQVDVTIDVALDVTMDVTIDVALDVGEPVDAAASFVDLDDAGDADDEAVVPLRVEPTRRPIGLRQFRLRDQAVQVPRPYTNMPDRTVGRVFFTDDRGRDRTCTGVALASANKSVVFTGGHCVESGASGGFHTNWVFVPAFGSCGGVCQPYGTWRATKLFTTIGWADDGNFRVDLGAAVVAPNRGRKMTTVLGGQGLITGAPPPSAAGPVFRNIGYPADPPFSDPRIGGKRQWMCLGATTGRDTALRGDGPDPVAMSCNMSGGASGGPWITALGRNGYGYVSGLTSYRYRRDRSTVYSPALGAAAAELYERAATAKVRG